MIHLVKIIVKSWPRMGASLLFKAIAHSFDFCVLETSIATVFLSNGHSLYAPTYLGWTSCLISFAWDQSTSQERVESDKTQNEKLLPTVGLKPTILMIYGLS